METKKLHTLQDALDKERKARLRSEELLRQKTLELGRANRRLADTNKIVEGIINGKNPAANSLLSTIMDPFIAMSTAGKAIWMNDAARAFFGHENDYQDFYPMKLVKKDYIDNTKNGFQELLQSGSIKNYRAKIEVNGKELIIMANASVIYGTSEEPIGVQGIIRDVTKEVEHKNLILTQKAQLDIIVGKAPLGIVLTNHDRIIRTNRTLTDLLGYGENELDGLHVQEISAPDDMLVTNEIMQELDSGQKSYVSIIKTYIKKDGSRFVAKCSISRQPDEKGCGVNQVAFIEDISKQQLAEERLRISENRLKSLVLNLQTGILLVDKNNLILVANKKYPELFDMECTANNIIGDNIQCMCKGAKDMFNHPTLFAERVDQLIAEKKQVLGEIIEMTNGKVLERDFIPIYIDGKYVGHLWSFIDITNKINHEKELELQKEKYSSIISNMNLGLVEYDTEDTIQFVNQAFCKMSGRVKSELLQRKNADLQNLTRADGQSIKGFYSKEMFAQTYEVRYVTPEQKEKFWHLNAAPRYDKMGFRVGTIVIYLDITEQKQLQYQKEMLLKELEQSNEGLKEYAHIVSHDLKSPLRSVSALATWMTEDYADILDESGVNNLSHIQEKIEGMDKLIDGILKYSTIKEDNLENTKVNVNEVIDEIKEIIYIPEHVKIVIKNKLPTIIADRTKIHQLIQNFLSNAVVHIDKDPGIVEVACEETPTHWQFSISDNGVGIKKEYHKKIFKIFQSISTKAKSTGIGLSIVKKIVTLYEGEVWLESELGQGTIFYFTLKR